MQERNVEPDKFGERIFFMSMFNDNEWTRKRKRRELYFKFRKSQDVREEILAGTLDVPRPWRREEVAWKMQRQACGKIEFHRFTDGATIQGNRSTRSSQMPVP